MRDVQEDIKFTSLGLRWTALELERAATRRGASTLLFAITGTRRTELMVTARLILAAIVPNNKHEPEIHHAFTQSLDVAFRFCSFGGFF